MFTARLLGGMSPMSWPSIKMCPSVGTSRPASMRNNVVLPQPEGPSSAKNSPGMMSRLTLSTPTAEPQRFEMLRKLMMGLTVGLAALATSAIAWSTELTPSLLLRPALHHHHDDHKHDREQDQHGRRGVDLRGYGEAQHRIDLDRERDRIRTGGEKRDHEVVERQSEGKQTASDQCRAHMRQQHVAECLPVVGAEVAGRLLLLLVEAREPRAHDERDEGEAERYVRDGDGAETERPDEVVGPGHDAREEQQHGNAHADFRHHDGECECALYGYLAHEAVAPQQNRCQRTDDERDKRGHQGDGQRVGEGD